MFSLEILEDSKNQTGDVSFLWIIALSPKHVYLEGVFACFIPSQQTSLSF